MKITCSIIKDLLPLYIENIASEDSRLLVDEHIAQCQECKSELDSLNQPNRFPPDTNTDSLKAIKRKVRSKHWKAVLLTALVVLTVAITVFSYLTAPEYIPYSEDLISVREKPDGSVVLEFDGVTGYPVEYYPSPDNPDHKIYHITLWTNILRSHIEGTQSIILSNADNIDAIYYYIDGAEDTLIYGTNPYPDGGVMTLPRLVLSYYVLMAVASAVIGIILLIIFKKKEKVKNIIEKIILLPVSYIIGHLCIKGFTTASYSAGRDFSLIVLIMIPVYATLLFLAGLYKEKKKAVN